MKALLISLVSFSFVPLSLAAAAKTDPCLKVAKEKSVAYERQWIKKNEEATPEDLKAVTVTQGEDEDSSWSQTTPKGEKYGVFVESPKTEDNTHWEIVLSPKTCEEVGKAVRVNAP